jgi:mycoredoxin
MPAEVVFYTRPRCPYSFRLRRKLRRRGLPFREVNIWRDAAAAAAARAAAGGNETVPTVRVGDRWLVNPAMAIPRRRACPMRSRQHSTYSEGEPERALTPDEMLDDLSLHYRDPSGVQIPALVGDRDGSELSGGLRWLSG